MATVNDCQYILAPSLQQLFRDVDTGLPLAAGTVEFYVDSSRITKKPVYRKTGLPSNPIFIELPNPLTLNMVGAFDEAVYYNPYDDQGNVQLYYIVVKNSQGVEQFTREGYPDVCDNSDTTQNTSINYWENPQFRLRLDVPNDGTVTEGQIVDPVTPLGYGGWQFAVPDSFTSTNIVTFETFSQTITDPEAHPPAAIIVECTNPIAAEGFKDLRKEFFDVNFLAGEDVTLQFEALTAGTPLTCDLVIIDNYGPGGSPTIEQTVSSFTINTNTFSKQVLNFTMPDNAGQTVSSNALDSSVFFAIRFPTSVLFECKFTNFLLQKGTFAAVDFPDYTVSDDVSEALAGSLSIPNPDNSDAGKVVRLGTVLRETSNIEYPQLILSPLPNDNYIYGGNFSTNPWARARNQERTFDFADDADKKYTADRFQLVAPPNDTENPPPKEFDGQVRRSSDVPSVIQTGVNSIYSLEVYVGTTAQTSICDVPYYLEYVIEGYDWQNLAQKPFNLSFWINSSVEGVYSIALSNDAGDTVYVAEYTVINADTWEFKTIAIPASIPEGGWAYDINRGLNINWNLTPVNTPATTINSWINPATPNDYVSPNQVNVLGNLGNSWKIDLIKLELGNIATGYSELEYAALRLKLQRYFESTYDNTENGYITAPDDPSPNQSQIQPFYRSRNREYQTFYYYKAQKRVAQSPINAPGDIIIDTSTIYPEDNLSNTVAGLTTFDSSAAQFVGTLGAVTFLDEGSVQNYYVYQCSMQSCINGFKVGRLAAIVYPIKPYVTPPPNSIPEPLPNDVNFLCYLNLFSSAEF